MAKSVFADLTARNMNRIWVMMLIFIGVGSLQPAVAQLPSDAVRAEMDKITKDADMKHASWGFYLVEAETGNVIAEHNPNLSLTPASTMKAITSATALMMLGENHTFQTTLEYEGKIDSAGTLDGNLVIKGGGDPTLGSYRLEGNPGLEDLMGYWVAALNKAGIKKVSGDVIGDGRLFGDAVLSDGWVWQDLGNYYAAGVSGLTIHENLYYAKFKTGASGTPATFLGIEPEVPGMEFTNQIVSKGNSDQGYIYGAPYTYHRYLRGSLPTNRKEFQIKGSMPEPPKFAAQALKGALEQAGIVVTGTAQSAREREMEGEWEEGKRTVIHTQKSPPLKDILWWLNKKSVNLFAEVLLRHVALEKTGSADPTKGTEAIEAFWKTKGVDTEGVFVYDGSGLSRYNAVTPHFVVSVLRHMKRSNRFDAYFESLPVAGKPGDVGGTLKSVGRGTSAEGKIFAKSGYISRVRGYVGYAKTQSGKTLCFAMLANNFTCKASVMRKKFEGLMVKMAEMP